MSKNYIVDSIYDFIKRIYKLSVKVTKINSTLYKFDLGNLGAFVIKTDAFNTEADLSAFRLGLSDRLNAVLNIA